MKYMILHEADNWRSVAMSACKGGDDNYPDTFQDAINMLISEGWEPLGGIATANPGNYSYLVQALIFR